MKRSMGLILLNLLWLAPSAGAQSPCGAVPDHVIAIYMKGATAEDKARLRQSFALLQKVDSQALNAFENVIVVDLANAPIDEISGVANPKHWMRATSGWTNDPALVQRYMTAIDFFRDTAGNLKPGLARQATTPKSTTNIRRVAGGAGSKAEAWEVVSAYEMVLRGFFTKEEVLEFGLKVPLMSGGEVEADVWVIHNGQKILIDQKHTVGEDPISRVSGELIDRWVRGLQAGDFKQVLIPTNQPPSAGLESTVRTKLIAGGLDEDLIRFVSDLGAF